MLLSNRGAIGIEYTFTFSFSNDDQLHIMSNEVLLSNRGGHL